MLGPVGASADRYSAQHASCPDGHCWGAVFAQTASTECRIQQDIAAAKHGALLEGVEAFKGCSHAVLRRLAACWHMQICRPEEVVLECGTLPHWKHTSC